jgi:hypothetical protein
MRLLLSHSLELLLAEYTRKAPYATGLPRANERLSIKPCHGITIDQRPINLCTAYNFFLSHHQLRSEALLELQLSRHSNRARIYIQLYYTFTHHPCFCAIHHFKARRYSNFGPSESRSSQDIAVFKQAAVLSGAEPQKVRES